MNRVSERLKRQGYGASARIVESAVSVQHDDRIEITTDPRFNELLTQRKFEQIARTCLGFYGGTVVINGVRWVSGEKRQTR